MLRSLRSWPDSAGSRLAYLAGAIAVFGMWSEHAAVGLADWRDWIVDATVGFTLLASGAVTHRRSPRVGSILLATAAGWWLGNVASGMLFVHRGLLALAVWTYPDGRIRARGGAAAVVAGSLVAVPVLARSDAGTAAFGAVVLAGALARSVGSAAGGRRLRRVAVRAAAVIALGGVGAAALRRGVADAVDPDVATLWYQATIAGAGVMLARGVRTRTTGAIADVVVELTTGPERRLRDRLADLLDDPDLAVARRAGDGWVDEEGRAIATELAGRVLTVVPGLATPIAIVHDASLANDPVLLDALASVTRLATRNAELDDATQRLLDDLVASRRRLLDAEDEERRRLSARLHSGVGRRLDAVEAHLVAAAAAVADRSVGDALQRARDQLNRTRDDLLEIAQGLHPGDPAGHLVETLSSLVAGLPVAVEVRAPSAEDDRVSAEAGIALSYCCAEALSNAVKHAGATRIVVELSIDGSAVRLVVTDDGVGGADVASGTGLRGLRDRVEALGGALRLESAPSAGTRLTVTLPSEPALLAVAGEARS